MVWSWAHIHLILNHIPIVGIPLISLLIIIALFKKDLRLAITAHSLFILLAIMTIAVFSTGYGAQSVLSNFREVDQSFLTSHHEASFWAFGAVLGLGSWSIHFIYRSVKCPQKFNLTSMLSLTLLLSLLASLLLAFTANLGGKISHPEIREVNLNLRQNPLVVILYSEVSFDEL